MHHLLIFFLFSFLQPLPSSSTHELEDLHCLLSFKASADPLNATLKTWNGFNPCSGSWLGVKCNGGRRVISIHLHNSSLTGTLTSLLGLNHLQVLNLRRNALTGTLPHLTNLTHPSLKHLLLSQNQLNGTLNISLPSLLSLRLEHNGFSGNLEALHLPIVKDFNVSENNLNGEISAGLSRFSVMAFGGNPSLCGSPLPSCVTKTTTTASLGMAIVLAISAGNLVVITIALVFVLTLYIWLKRKLSHLELNEEQCPEDKRNINGVGGVGLVCFEGGEELKLECLLKASAEVLGKSVAGSSYKAMLDNGMVMAVKRLNASRFINGGKGFEKRIHLVGRLRHPQVVSLRACYNGNEEKLLIYDFMPNGNLQSLLQNQGTTRALEWRRRKEILIGAAQGLNFIHSSQSRTPLVHGNIKPSNILIDEKGNACISEGGLMCSISSSNMNQCFASHSSHLFSGSMHRHGYRAPELMSGKVKATQASDVYSFGMVLLEVVTDEKIDARECEGELMGMVKVGMLCTNECPDERPTMNEVVTMISEFM